jgi:Rieske Fe-S protein
VKRYNVLVLKPSRFILRLGRESVNGPYRVVENFWLTKVFSTFSNNLEEIMTDEEGIKRRKFMEMGIFAFGGAIVAISGSALARFAAGPAFDKTEEKWIEIDDAEIVDEDEGVSALVVEFEIRDGYMVRQERALVYPKKTKKGEIVAMSANCTHLACIVNWVEEEKMFLCPCHNGKYDSNGMVISGPPPKPLRRHKTKFEDGQLYVSTQTVAIGDESHV